MKKKIVYTTQNLTETSIYEVNEPNFYSNFFLNEKNLVIIIDENLNSLDIVNSKQYKFNSNESHKSLNGLHAILELFQQAQLDKSSHVLAIGGGSLTDLVGFAASIYHRGIPYSTVPSTLLSMIDAGIGGKNGINFSNSKNQIGTIYQPKNIFIDQTYLNYLPSSERAQGMAEMIKYGIAFDLELFEILELYNLQSLFENQELLSSLIFKSIQIKSNLVSLDPMDKKERNALNFGHTIGHAIEQIYQLPHGSAIGLGMIASTAFSIKKFATNSMDLDRLRAMLLQYELPIKLHNIDTDKIVEKINQDKKKRGHEISFIFLDGIGRHRIEIIEFEELVEFINANLTALWS